MAHVDWLLVFPYCRTESSSFDHGTYEESSPSARHEQGRHCRGACIGLRTQEVRVLQGTWHSRQCCHAGGEEDWKVHAPRLVYAQNPNEASKEDSESIRSFGVEEKHLMCL